MMKLKVLDLFSGLGGFSLGLERTGGFETVAFCEIEPFPRRVLAKHWPEVPCYEDVRTLTGARLAADGIAGIDVITGGFPCQAFSTASRGRKTAPDIWPEMARVVDIIRPSFAIAENVAFDPIAKAADWFSELGMQCDVVRISGADVGSPTARRRWWAVAHPYKNGELQSALNAEVAKLPEIHRSIWGPENYRAAVCLSDGVSSRLGAGEYGNAVVPQIPEMIGRAILNSLDHPDVNE
jgi:DNA (cytosine-5)-methyltransferase 1